MAKKKEKPTYQVVSPFQDKYSKQVYNVGDVYQADSTRAKELKGYIKEVKEHEPSK
jgi:hypothetical protein